MGKIDFSGKAFSAHLFDENPLPMLVFDRDSLEIVKANRAALTKYKYSREEFLDLTLKDICSEEDLSSLIHNLRKSDAQKAKQNLRHKTSEGESF
jgi:PAS domain-containing protein